MYIATVHILQTALEKKYSTEIKSLYLGDSKPLLNGRLILKEVVNKNINTYLQDRSFLIRDLNIDVSVRTKKGLIIYPSGVEEDENVFLVGDFLKIASENYNILEQGLDLEVSVSLEPNTFLSGLIFFVFLIISLFFLYFLYSSDKMRIKRETQKKNDEIFRLREFENKNSERLLLLYKESEHLKNLLSKMRNKVDDASRVEDGMFEEIVRLEEEVGANFSLQKIQQEEITILNEEIEKLKNGKKKVGKQKIKLGEATLRRFNALYKNISVHDRAIEGYADLEEDLRLKCEEVIHKLNESPETVSVKRKVFGKKGSKTVFEIIFAYKGRLYFRNINGGKIEILAVGTKNTQDRELEFINKL